MAILLMGEKIGMTRRWNDDGTNVPVTVIKVGPCVVTQLRTPENDGYAAVQVGYGDVKPRRSTIPMIGHDAKAGTGPKRAHREFRVDEQELAGFTLGQELTVKDLAGLVYVDVTGTSKGKGRAGVMKRHGFKGMFASHGTERMHRHGGSIASHATQRGECGKPKKGKRMGGQMGNERVTMRSLDVVAIDEDNGILMVKGPVPGANRGIVEIRSAVRLYGTKGRRQAEAAKK